MAETGEPYTQALTHILRRAPLEPLPAAWHITGSRSSDYEVGLLPESVSYDGNRVAGARQPAWRSRSWQRRARRTLSRHSVSKRCNAAGGLARAMYSSVSRIVSCDTRYSG